MSHLTCTGVYEFAMRAQLALPANDFAPCLITSPCSYPALLAFCNGDESAPMPFRGAFKAEPLRRFLQDFQGGRKCAKAVRLDASTDFGALRVAQLKELLRDRGVLCPECSEKKDYVQRLRDIVLAQSS